jgi:hypothetical protein
MHFEKVALIPPQLLLEVAAITSREETAEPPIAIGEGVEIMIVEDVEAVLDAVLNERR